MILAIDTSTCALAIALVKGETLDNIQVIGEYKTDIPVTHAVQALAAIDNLLSSCQCPKSALKRVAVVAGPGSYTGLRIGVTIAKTLAWGLGIELVGVSSLEALAYQSCHFSGCIFALINARRQYAYTAVFSSARQILTRIGENDEYRSIASVAEQACTITEPILFTGGSALDFQVELLANIRQNKQITFINKINILPSAIAIAMLGINKAPVPAHEFAPSYIRLTEAERNWLGNNKL